MQEEFTINSIVPLILKVSDIRPYDKNDVSFPYSKVVLNKVGTIKNCVTDVTWNINLKELLGSELYNNYDYFNLELVQFLSVPMTGGGNGSNPPFFNNINLAYRTLNCFIYGLQCYNGLDHRLIKKQVMIIHLCFYLV
jgi:hypothetical protein